jgi:hypothetical protein
MTAISERFPLGQLEMDVAHCRESEFDCLVRMRDSLQAEYSYSIIPENLVFHLFREF